MSTASSSRIDALRYVAAAGIGGLCTAIVAGIPALHLVPYLPMFGVVALTARFWGAGPAVVTTISAAVLVDYVVFPPQMAWSLEATDLFRTAAFIAVCLVITSIARLRTSAEHKLRAALTEANQALLTERALRESLQTAQEVGRVAAWTLDVKSGKLTWTENAQAVFAGSKLVENLDEFFTRLHPDDIPAMHVQARQLAERVIAAEFRLFDDAGLPRWYHTRSEPIRNKKGEVERVVGATVDITEMKDAQQALVRSEKLAAAGRMAASIAHEINNPLNSVGNLIFLAQNHPRLPEEAREWLSQANEELMRTARIAQQTLGFYKDTTGPSMLDLHAVVQEVLRFYSVQAKRRRVQVHLAGSPVWITGKTGELRQAVSNILINAIDATPEGGKVEISVAQEGKRAVIRVRDNGPGIPDALRERIFEPFFTTKKDIGTGLGLWTTRQLLHAAGGGVELGNDGPGAEFVLWLPRHTQSTEPLGHSAD